MRTIQQTLISLAAIWLAACGGSCGFWQYGSCDSIFVNFRNSDDNGLQAVRSYEALPFN